jgi:pimeloyl-ACP methyl ester carboxylesterase
MKQTSLDIGLKLNVLDWEGEKTPFVLVHGLSSNCRTWLRTAEILARAGHRVIAYDQRGHGLSEKPEDGYDFASVTGDLAAVLDALELARPIVVGQSWGGNVVLEFGARYPGRAHALGFVDGGFLDMHARPQAVWEDYAAQLTPPDFSGTLRSDLKERIIAHHPDWGEEGAEATLANFETLPDGTIRPWLSLDRHMQILRAMWAQKPRELFPLVREPVLICAAEFTGRMEKEEKEHLVQAALRGLPTAEVRWFPGADHDIHVHKPRELAELFLASLESGIWRANKPV